MARYFGVRHLSPACAFYVTQFLDRVSPAAVLIEGPSDLNELIKPLCSVQTHLPAAILAYTDAPVRTVLWPFAEFSPEYAAMKWAIERDVPVCFCDLPSTCILARQDKEEETEEKDTPQTVSVYERIEEISGNDNDSFWEYGFEQCRDYDDFISAVHEYGKGLREFSNNDSRNMLREAFMRRTIADWEKRTAGEIAVITGAFHTMGIENMSFTDLDRSLTDDLPFVNTRATLMPYSYYRLSSRSGYGAGSKAPSYFELLWRGRQTGRLSDTAAIYLSEIAAFQRENGYSASTAEVIEAKRLADTLAALRGAVQPCLADLRDAAVTCIGHGSFGEISLACADTEIGTKIGELPEGTVCTSVQEDFTRQLKCLKLEKFRKASSEDISLDLRENLRVKSESSAFLDLNRSTFLHRLRILNIHFGEQLKRHQDNATWAENWRLAWSPETEIEIVEASLSGDTIEQAAENTLRLRLGGAESVAQAAAILSDAFLCGLSDSIREATYIVQGKSAVCSSAADVGKTLGMLSGIVRFGNIRKTDPAPVIPLMEKLFLKFCLLLPSAAVCDRQAAEELTGAVDLVNDACLSHDFLDEQQFVRMISNISGNDIVNPMLAGFCCAVLTERGVMPEEKLSAIINRRLSKGTPAADAAMWFEGLAKKNRRSLISRLSVWKKLCEFISGLDDDEFKPVLVCLRRTFADFTPSEKSDIAENIGEVMGISRESAAEVIMTRITSQEQEAIDSLDDFDFGDI